MKRPCESPNWVFGAFVIGCFPPLTHRFNGSMGNCPSPPVHPLRPFERLAGGPREILLPLQFLGRYCAPGWRGQCSSAVEQRFRKPPVAVSIPAIGSIPWPDLLQSSFEVRR